MLDRCVPCWNGVIIDGMFGAEKERDLISAFAARNNFPVFTVFVAIDPSLAMQRARAKYPDHVEALRLMCIALYCLGKDVFAKYFLLVASQTI